MRYVMLTARRHHRKLVAALFFGFACVFAVGLVRLFFYTLPMLSGNYAQAAYEQSSMYRQEYGSKDNGIGTPVGSDKGLDKRIARGWAEFVDLCCGDRLYAQYDLALQYYENYQYDPARENFERAYARACQKNGVPKAEYRQLSARMQLYIGNSLCNLGKDKDAPAAYERGLEAFWNMLTVWNLERLQDSQKGGGSGSGDKGDNPGGSKKKI